MQRCLLICHETFQKQPNFRPFPLPVAVQIVYSPEEAERVLEGCGLDVALLDSTLLSPPVVDTPQGVRLPVLVTLGKPLQEAQAVWRGFPVEGHLRLPSSLQQARITLGHAYEKAKLWKSFLLCSQEVVDVQNWSLPDRFLRLAGAAVIVTEGGAVVWVDAELKKNFPYLTHSLPPVLADLLKCPEGEYEVTLVLTSGVKRHYEVKKMDIPQSEGQALWAFLAGKGHGDNGGVSRDMVGLFLRDVTEQREAYRELLTSELRFRSIVDSLSDALITCDEKGRVTSWSCAAEELFRVGHRYALNRDIGEFIECKDSGSVLDLWKAETSSRPLMGRVFKLQGKRADGTHFPAEVTVGSWQTEEGRWYSFIVRDVSEREQWQTRWFHAEKLWAVGQLAAGIAHELNTPIQYIGDNIRFLQSSLGPLLSFLELVPEATGELQKAGNSVFLSAWSQAVSRLDLGFVSREIPQALQESLVGVERVANIVRAIKDFSHPGSGDFTPLDINRAIHTALTMSRSEWKYVADVTLHLDEELPCFPALTNEVHQVLLNLIVNAAQAIAEKVKGKEEKGSLSIETFREDDFVVVKIQDTGIGIPEENHHRIFEPFFTTKPPGKGTGQGLAIAYDVVVHKHGGEISFTSRAGEGTTFFVRLPLFRRGECDV